MSSSAPVVGFVRGLGKDRIAAERRLAEQGVVLPITERVDLLPHLGNSDSILAMVTDHHDGPIVAANVGIVPSRVMPGHRRFRVARFSASATASVDTALLTMVVDLARKDSRCLSVSVEVFERDGGRRARLGQTLAKLGFEKVRRQRSYQKTLALDLGPSEADLLQALSGDTRRCIRSPLKRNLELRPVVDVALADRVQALVRDTFQRTGAQTPRFPWREIIACAAREPSLSYINGVFDPSRSGPDSLVSFAWGIMHPGYATYAAGAAMRRPDLRSISLGYAPLWDLVLWARRNGATWFDFGGVTSGSRPTADDPVGGISAFKRSFTQNVVEVGEEWTLKPHPLRGSIAEWLAHAARLVPRSTGAA